MADLRVKIAGVAFENPLIAASGTFALAGNTRNSIRFLRLGGFPARELPFRSVQEILRHASRRHPREC